MIQELLNHLEQADSGLFIHAPEGICQRLAEVLGDAGKPLAGLTETDDSQRAIKQLVDQLAVEPEHTIAATLEAASRQMGEPIYVLIDHAERLEYSDLTYALKAARDALASSELSGLRLAFFSIDRAALERMTRLRGSPFFYASLIDVCAITFAELIKYINEVPADFEAVVEGYETGLDPIHQVKAAEITRNPGLGAWEGKIGFQECEGENALAGAIPGHTETPRQAVVILGRRGERRS